MPGLPPGKDPDALPSYHQPQLPGSSSAAQVRLLGLWICGCKVEVG
jgi:hypothetical protein